MPTDRTLTLSLRVSVPLPLESDASLVVIGAHHFGQDTNDQVYPHVRKHRWASVALVEASPLIAAQLRENIALRPPFPLVNPENISVIAEGVCPNVGDKARTLPFFSFTATQGLPYWASMIGSFDYAHVAKHVTWMLQMAKRNSNWTRARLLQHIVPQPVVCRSLPSMLQRQHIVQPSVLLIDTEALDCRLVASTDWCQIRPHLLVFERTHCSNHDLVRALQRLRGVGLQCTRPRWRQIAQTSDNLYFRIVTDERDEMADLIPLDRVYAAGGWLAWSFAPVKRLWSRWSSWTR